MLTLLAALNLLVTRQSRAPKGVGVFFSSEVFCMKCCSWGFASHWPTALYIFSLSPRSYEESTWILCCRSHKKEGTLHIIASRKTLDLPYLTTYSGLLILITILPALPTSFQILYHHCTSHKNGTVWPTNIQLKSDLVLPPQFYFTPFQM